tara:strand:+ start:2678 stop:2953 length:276 start_codon:yes stop_codon:yes gene_type:complete
MASRKVNLTNAGEFQNAAFAQSGFRVVSDTFSQPAGEIYVAIYCLAVATNVTTTTPSGDALAGVDMQQGMIVYGDFTTVSVGTGTVIAYIR